MRTHIGRFMPESIMRERVTYFTGRLNVSLMSCRSVSEASWQCVDTGNGQEWGGREVGVDSKTCARLTCYGRRG